MKKIKESTLKVDNHSFEPFKTPKGRVAYFGKEGILGWDDVFIPWETALEYYNKKLQESKKLKEWSIKDDPARFAQQIISKAIDKKYISQSQAQNKWVKDAALQIANDHSDDDEIGSSDWTAILQEFSREVKNLDENLSLKKLLPKTLKEQNLKIEKHSSNDKAIEKLADIIEYEGYDKALKIAEKEYPNILMGKGGHHFWFKDKSNINDRLAIIYDK